MITAKDFEYEKFNFPAGEMHIRIKHSGSDPCIVFSFERNEEILEILLIADALKGMDRKLGTLTIEYMPFGRQDRRAVEGECFSLKVFASLINSIGFRKVYINDPHSEVTTALIERAYVIDQSQIFGGYLTDIKRPFYLVAPDGGSLKKIYKLAKWTCATKVIECSKKRDVETGDISGVQVNAIDLEGVDCYIVDDICDGGRTFVEVAKELKKLNCGKVVLMVTHGLFTKGLGVFEGLIDEVYTMKGQVK